MKKQFLSVLLTLAVSSSLFSQKVYTTADVFTEKNIVWMGIDFSKCKFIGYPSIHGNMSKPPDVVVKYYFKDWNLIPVKEADKYDIRGAFEKEYVYYDVEYVIEKNKLVNSDSLISITNNYKLNPAEFQSIVSDYKSIAKEGIGVVYIAERLNSETDLGTFYVVVFDIATKKILLQELIEGEAHGAVLKTFWAGAIHEVIEKNRKVYKKWKKAAMVK